MKAIQITFDERLLEKLDNDEDNDEEVKHEAVRCDPAGRRR